MQQTPYGTAVVADTDLTCATSPVAWSAIIAGGLASLALTSILAPLGSALGLAAGPGVRAYDYDGVTKGLTIASVVWMIVVAWISSGFGGYFTGRLRNRFVGAHHHEVFFRDTVHGFLAWGVSTLIIGAVIGGLAGHAMHHGYRADDMRSDTSMSADQATPGQPATPTDEATREQARKDAAKASFFLFLSLIIGAFISATAAALGGRHRDVHYVHGRLVE